MGCGDGVAVAVAVVVVVVDDGDVTQRVFEEQRRSIPSLLKIPPDEPKSVSDDAPVDGRDADWVSTLK